MLEAPIVATAVRGDAGALAFLREMAMVLHYFDDAIDRDKAIADETIHGVLFASLVTLPRNAFYRDNFEALNAILVSAIANWRIANVIERNDPTIEALAVAFIIRSTYVDLVTMSAVIIGGMEWAVACGPELRAWAHAEGFGRYVGNLGAEKRAREGDK